MRLMEIDRRSFCKAGIASVGVFVSETVAGRAMAASNSDHPSIFAAARKEANGAYSAALFSLQGDVASVPLPGRGHDVAVHPLTKEVVVFARRPGRFAVCFSHKKNKAPFSFFAQPQRHFYGHGVFSTDGRLLFTSENDYAKGLGVIGVRDATDNYKWIGEFPSHGVGPHDLALLSDGHSLVVANGGIETHPDMGRTILNLAEMTPSLVYIDCRTGDLLEKHKPPAALRQLSIRHLTVTARDRVVFGCQYKGPKGDRPALMGMHDRGGELRFLQTPADVRRQLNNYIGSVCADASGEVIAASAPRGNLIGFWRANDGMFLGSQPVRDGCGLAKARQKKDFLITSGHGHVYMGGKETPFDDMAWDNHAVRVF